MPEASQSAGDRRTYEELLEELERLCARLSSSDVGVEEATELFERALGLQREARQRLDELTERVDRLIRAEEAAGQAEQS